MVTPNAYGRLLTPMVRLSTMAPFALDTIKGAKQGVKHDPCIAMDDIAKVGLSIPTLPEWGWGPRLSLQSGFSKGSPTGPVPMSAKCSMTSSVILWWKGPVPALVRYRLHHNTVRLSGGLFHDIKKKRSAVVFLTVSSLLLAGCFYPL